MPARTQFTLLAKRKERKGEKVRNEYSAGGVVFRIARRCPEIAFILDPYKKWAFAKGHIKIGETPHNAALRETREEMGLRNLRVIAYLGNMDFWFRDRFVYKGMLIHKRVYYFLMQTPSTARAQPQRSEKIQSVRWVSVSRARKVLSYKNSAEILDKAIQLLLKPKTTRSG